MKPHWEHFEHGADIGVRGIGRTLEEAFEQAAIALCAVVTEPERVEPVDEVQIEIDGSEPDLLLVDWLNRLVYEMAVGHRLFSRFDISIDESRLRATARGEKTDRARHEPAVEIKGATFTELRVEPMDGGWLAQCVVDV